jgi:2-methylaconitate cis-trans-isomerase PrpF
MTGIRCLQMRGGTSRGLYFVAADLPSDPADRDALLVEVMGSGHPLQIDGVGGGHPLASKVAVVSPSQREDADIDYLFFQLGVDAATITNQQNCGNILAGVGPFAVERGLVEPGEEATTTRIAMVNSGSVVTATFGTPGGVPRYAGDTAIDGVPGAAAAILLRFADTAGAELAAFGSAGHFVDIEHPTGHLEVEVDLDTLASPPLVRSAGVIRTARKLFDGAVFPSRIPPNDGAHHAPAARHRPPRQRRAADSRAGEEPVVLHPDPRADRERHQRRLGLHAHLG